MLICLSIRSINNLNRCIYIASCVFPSQPYRDITSVLFCRLINVDILLLLLTICIRYKTEMHVNRHDTLLMRYTCTCTLQPYRDITSVLFCRLINVDILLLLVTIFIISLKCTQTNKLLMRFTCPYSSYL